MSKTSFHKKNSKLWKPFPRQTEIVCEINTVLTEAPFKFRKLNYEFIF